MTREHQIMRSLDAIAQARGLRPGRDAASDQTPPSADGSVLNDEHLGINVKEQVIRGAVDAITRRQAVLDVDPQARDGHGALSRRGLPEGASAHDAAERVRQNSSLPNMATVDPPIAVTAAGRPSFNTPHASAPSPRQDDAESLWKDIRALLDHVGSGASIEILDRRMEDLARKVDQHLSMSSSSGVTDDLLRRIDALQESIKAPAPDRRVLNDLFVSLDERAGMARAAADDVQRLQETMATLARRIEATSQTSDGKDLSTLEAQIERLTQRLERSDVNLFSLDTVEHSLRDLFAQLEQTRHATVEAAERAARVAAHDTMQAALRNPVLTTSSDLRLDLIEKVAEEVEDLKLQHDSSERRTQAALAGLHQLVEMLVRRLSQPQEVESDRAPAVSTGLDKGAHERHAIWSTVDLEPMSGLIEPGSDRSPRFAADVSHEDAGRLTSWTNVPSHNATGDMSYPVGSEASKREVDPARAGTAGSLSRLLSLAQGVLGQTWAALALQRRPMVLGLAGLALAIGVFEATDLGPGSVPTVNADGASPARLSPSGLEASSEPVILPQPDQTRASDTTASIAPGKAPVPPPAPQAALTTIEADPALATLPPDSKSSLPVMAEAEIGATGPGGGLKAMALAGDPAAEYEMGLRYVQGRSVTRDPKAAATWFQKAAEHGSAQAAYRLGLAFEKGVGEPRDSALAMSWYGHAADAGNMRAIHNLAVMTAEGAVGKPDYAKAAALFERAATLGVRDSQFNLAILLARGLGVARNLSQSYTWFALAAAQGDEDAAKKRDEVGARLDAKTLEAAKAAAETFKTAPNVRAANEVPAPAGGWSAVPPPPRSDLSDQKVGGAKSPVL